jgi:hypothetical protein
VHAYLESIAMVKVFDSQLAAVTIYCNLSRALLRANIRRSARLCEKGGAKREREAPAEPTNSMRARKTNVLGLGGSLALIAGNGVIQQSDAGVSATEVIRASDCE